MGLGRLAVGLSDIEGFFQPQGFRGSVMGSATEARFDTNSGPVSDTVTSTEVPRSKPDVAFEFSEESEANHFALFH